MLFVFINIIKNACLKTNFHNKNLFFVEIYHRIGTLCWFSEIKHVQNIFSWDLRSISNLLCRRCNVLRSFTNHAGVSPSSGSRRHRFRLESRGRGFPVSVIHDHDVWRSFPGACGVSRLPERPGVMRDIVATRVVVTIVRRHSYSDGFISSVH